MPEPLRTRRTRRPANAASRVLLPVLLASAVLAGCSTQPPKRSDRSPQDVRAQLQRLMPMTLADRSGWAADIQAAFQVLELPPTTANLCAVLAVIEQESGYQADPPVPGLGRIAREEIDRRAAGLGIPTLAVDAALLLKAPDGLRYRDKLAAVRTERELNDLFEELVARAPMGRGLLARANPVRTGGPMQVSIDYATDQLRQRPYPYPLEGSVRDEVFSRRGGLYFGIAHLLKYPNSYARHLHRFADFNAGHYASRNAAFQAAVSVASGVDLVLDGDLIVHGSKKVGTTETAVRSLATSLDMSHRAIRRDLERGDRHDFERSTLYQRVFALAQARGGRALPRATMPRITLDSPKISRELTTEWFANNVERRYRRCEARAAAL